MCGHAPIKNLIFFICSSKCVCVCELTIFLPLVYQALMALFPLKKNQVFINFAKDQKSYGNVDSSIQGSTISVDSQDDRL